MIAQLSEITESATPTAFHRLLRTLDQRNKLLRVYTQNIDALESKSGLTFGVPEIEDKRFKSRLPKGKAEGVSEDILALSDLQTPPHSQLSAPARRLLSPPVETPRCIPLHGTLEMMHCQICTHSFPLREHLEALTAGHPPYCPECTSLETTRQLIGKRSRGVGKLRPSVVLYNEMHKDGEEVGEVVRRDLVGSSKGKGRAGADLLLVVGTSLRVPGTKRIVREFAKAVRHSASQANALGSGGGPPSSNLGSRSALGLATPTPSPRRTPSGDEEPPIKTVYLNFDFPVPTREWEGVFDVWVRGDAQEFARMVDEELEKEAKAKEAAIERKKKRQEEAALAAEPTEQRQQSSGGKEEKEKELSKGKKGTKDKQESGNGKKRKNSSDAETSSIKRRKVAPRPTPESNVKVVPTKRKASPKKNTLPTLSRRKTKKKEPEPKLILKISSSRRRFVPEVVIHRDRKKSNTLQRATTPEYATPPSPLTPLPSPPLSVGRCTSSKSIAYRDAHSGSNILPHSDREPAVEFELGLDDLSVDYSDQGSSHWDIVDDMSDSMDLNINSPLPVSYIRTTASTHDTRGQ